MRRRQLLKATAPALAIQAGCLGGGGPSTPTATATPVQREFPYTAASPEANVAPRTLTLNNRTPNEYDATVRLIDPEADVRVMDRTVTIPGEQEHVFEDVIGKIGEYVIRFSLAVGVEKRYEWPIDEAHGDASITIAEGDSPVEPVVWYSITDL